MRCEDCGAGAGFGSAACAFSPGAGLKDTRLPSQWFQRQWPRGKKDHKTVFRVEELDSLGWCNWEEKT